MNFRWGRLVAVALTIFSLPVSAQGQSGIQWQDIQRLLRQNGFTGVFENNDQSDWASNRALITFCRNIDCSKYEKKGSNSSQDELESWNEALRQGIVTRSAGNYYTLETVSARPVETKASFVDSGRKIVSFDGDDFSIWQADNFARLSFHRIGLSSEFKWDYDLVLSKNQDFSAAINKYWITIIDNRSGLIVGWLPLTLHDRVKFEAIESLDRPAVSFLPDTSKLLVARADGLAAVFDWTTRDLTVVRNSFPKGTRAKPFIAATPSATAFVVGFERKAELLIARNISGEFKITKAAAPQTKYFELQAISETSALFKADGSPNTGFFLDLTTARAQPFKTNSICTYPGTGAFREAAQSERTAELENSNLSVIERQFDCESKTLVSFGAELCRTLPCQDSTSSIDILGDGSKVLMALRAGFVLLTRDKSVSPENWKISLPPTLGPNGLSSDMGGSPFAFSERGQVFDARANSGPIRLKANLESASVVRVANGPSATDWIALSKNGELTVAQAGRAIRRVALSSPRDPDNAQLFVANNGRTAVVVLPTSKNSTSRDWGGSDVAIVDIESLAIKKSFRVNPVNAPKDTPQIWVLSQTTATMLNDGRHLAISIYEPVIQIFDIQSGNRVRTVSTAPSNLRWSNNELASSNFVKSLRTINETFQRLNSSPAKLSPKGQQGLTVSLGITGFIDVNMIATVDSVFSDSVIASSALRRFSQVIETANTGEHVILFSSGLLAKVDSSGNVRTTYDTQGIKSIARLGSDDLIYAITTAGMVKVLNEKTGVLIAELAVYHDGEWLMKTPEGFFDASKGGGARVAVRTGPTQVVPIDSVYDVLYRPDLVREKLAGDPDGKVKAAAAQLDLEKVMASGKAPRVAISVPVSGMSSSIDELEVEVRIVDQGGGVGKMEWRVNGVTLGIETRGFERIDGSGAHAPEQTIKRKIALDRGENRIEFVAYNARNLIASEASQVTVKWDGERTATPPKLFVLTVGINDYYDSRLRLTYAVPDAVAVAEGFKKAASGLYGDVDVTKILDAEVTIANVEKIFNDLGRRVQPRDVFVFFLAGHGKTKNGRYYFLPRDFRYEDESSIERAGMDQDRFQAWFAKIPARKSILLYDTCESGSLTGANTRGSDIDERLGALNRMARATGRTFLTATTDDAPAMEGYRGHGVFTYALLDALGRADVNNNGLIEVSELADHVDTKVPDFSFEAFKLRQIPQRSIVGNNFALINKTAILSDDGQATRSSTKQGEIGVSSLGEAIPTKPTHVVVAAVDVKATAGEASATIVQLSPGTQVRFISSHEGWMLIARDGRLVGYVQSKSIAGLQ